jgi:hypothetical protein
LSEEETREEAQIRESVESVGGWLAPLLVTAYIIGITFIVYNVVGVRPTTWEYGVLPYIPARSTFSTQSPPVGVPPLQVEYPQGTSGGANVRR